MLIALTIINILLWVCIATLFTLIIIYYRKDNDTYARNVGLKEDLKVLTIKYGLLEEAFADYKQANPIKTKYRNGASVFIVENKKPHKGVIVEIRQDAERRIFYTVQYKEEGRSGIKSVNRPQHEVYETLAIAIESEQLITL